MLSRLKAEVLDLIFPKWCVGCGKGGDFVCESCRRTMVPIHPPVCPRCGSPQPSGIVCPSCVAWHSHIDGIRSPFKFEGVMRPAIHSLKYRNIRALAPLLAGMLADYLAANPVPVDTLVPLPLHPRRLRERGYNQSQLIAAHLAKITALPLVDDCVFRSGDTLPQARTSSVEERRANVVGAFSCRKSSLAGKNVLLIDDVSTSGSTLDACAAALKEGGSQTVWGLTVAREV